MRRSYSTYIALTIMFCTLFIPLSQDIFQFKKWIKPLDGAYFKAQDADLSAHGWFSSAYQDQKEKYLKQNFGLGNYYVRLINEINFRLFRKPSAAFVVVGKDDFLYETAYIDAYYGRDFVGHARVNDLMQKLRSVQDSMSKRGKLLMVVFAPGKASFYPEYIPYYFGEKTGPSNYDAFSMRASETGVNHIDFNDYFIKNKKSSHHPLYPQYGIHWSNYGSMLALDSIIRYAEKKLKVNLPDMIQTRLLVSDSLRPTDDDVLKSLNLFTKLKSFPMAYPSYTVVTDSTSTRSVKLLVIGDSFWWHIFGSTIPERVFAKNSFWYYNEEIYPESFTQQLLVSQIDYANRIREADVIMLIHSEMSLYKFGGGFVEMAYETYCRPGHINERIQRMKESIRNTPEWFEQVEKKAALNGISVDSMVTIDALYSLREYIDK